MFTRGRTERLCIWLGGGMLSLYAVLIIGASVASAGPEGAQVVRGEVSFQQKGHNTTVYASDRAIVNYNKFDIGRPEVVRFVQPGADASVLNRILSANPTMIDGTLTANGRVFFVNPAGVIIGSGARINVNQLVASALNISNDDFINGRFRFADGRGAVVNRGKISANEVALIGKEVLNAGVIDCPSGYVLLAAGDRVFLAEPNSDVLVEVELTLPSQANGPDQSSPVIVNEGTIEAGGGSIILAAAGDAYSQAISNVGSLSVSGKTGGGGEIRIEGGQVSNAGSIMANAADNAMAGDIEIVAGMELFLEQASLIEARGKDVDSSGGNVYLYSRGNAVAREGQTIDISGGTISGSGGAAELSAGGSVSFGGMVLGSAQEGYENGSFVVDPLEATVEKTTLTADTIIWAEDDITIKGVVTLDTSSGHVTLSLLADHKSEAAGDWDDGSGVGGGTAGTGVIVRSGGGTVEKGDAASSNTATLVIKAADDGVGSGGIGTTANPIRTDVDVLDIEIRSTSSGSVNVTEADGVRLSGIQAPDAGSTVAVTVSAGDLGVSGSVAAGGGYELTASNGDVVFESGGSVTGGALSSIESTKGSIVNAGSEEAVTIGTTGVGSDLWLVADNSDTQSSSGMTVVSGGALIVNAPLDNASSTTTLSAADEVIINENIADATAISAHAGTAGNGDISFGGGVNLDSPSISLRAGDGAGGGGTGASVDVWPAPTMANTRTFSLEQDALLSDATVWDLFGDPSLVDLTLSSYDSTLTFSQGGSWASINGTGNGGVAVLAGLQAAGDLTFHAGADGTDNLSFGAGVTLESPAISFRAGDGPGGAGTDAFVNLSPAPTIANTTVFTLEQDAALTDAEAWSLFADPSLVDLTISSYDSTLALAQEAGWKSIDATGMGGLAILANLQTTGDMAFNSGLSGIDTGGQILDAGAGSISFVGDEINLGTTADTIITSGPITLEPTSKNAAIDVGGALAAFNLDDAEIAAIKDGASSITIGRADGEHAITVDEVAFNDPAIIRTPLGGSISVDGQITGAGDASITLQGSGATTTLNADIVTSGQNIAIEDSVVIGQDAAVTLDTGQASGGDISVSGSVSGTPGSGNEDLALVSGGGATTLSGDVGSGGNIGVLALQADNTGATGGVTFDGDVTAETLVTFGQGYEVVFNEDVVVSNDTTFANTGGLTLGDGDDDAFLFSGGLEATAGDTTARGSVRTSGDAMDIGELALGGDLVLDTTDNWLQAGGALRVGGPVSGADKDLSLVSGVGATTVDGTLESIGTLTVQGDNAWATGDATFGGNVTVETLVTFGHSYSVTFNGDASIATDTTFANTGGLSLGDGDDDLFVFDGGLDTTAGGATARGTVRTSDDRMDIGSLILSGDLVLDTTDNWLGTGAALHVTGPVSGGGSDLSLVSGVGATTVDGAISDVGTLALQADNTGATGGVTFGGDVTADTLVTFGHSYSISFNEDASIATDTVFANSGGLMLGNGDDDELLFAGGLDTRASAVTARGAVRTSDSAMDVGELTIPDGTLTLDTTNKWSGAGAALHVAGPVAGGDNNLSLISGSGTTVVDQAVASVGSLTVQGDNSGATGGVTFGGDVTADTLATFGHSYSVAFNEDVSIETDTTFANTGGLVLGDAGEDRFMFDGGVDTTASATVARGTVRTSDDPMDIGALTLSGDLVLDTTNSWSGGGAALEVAGPVSGGDNDLSLVAGAGAITVDGSVSSVGTLTVQADNAGATGDVTFNGDVTAETLTTFGRSYALALNEDATITNDMTFANTGGVTLGDGDDDVLLFDGGLDTTVGGLAGGGAVRTSDDPMDIGALTLSGDLVLDTTNSWSGAGAALDVTGPVAGGDNDLSLVAGAGAITVDGSVSSVGTLTVQADNAVATGDVTFNGDVTAETLTTFEHSYALALNEDATITNDMTFANTGGVTLGDGDDDVLLFDGGLDTTAGALAGRGYVRTSDDPMDVASLTVSGGSLTLDTTNDWSGGGADLHITGPVTGGGNLSLVSGGGATTVDQAVNSVGSLTLQGDDVRATGSFTFDSDVVADSLEAAGRAYSVTMKEDVTITGDSVLLNTAGVVLGDGSDDVFAFSGGLDTAASATTAIGTITSSNADIDFGPLTLAGDLDVSSGGAGGGSIGFAGTVDGSTAFAETLVLTAGTGNIDFSGEVGGTTALGDVTINSAANVTARDAFVARSFVQAAGTGKTWFKDMLGVKGPGNMDGGAVSIDTSGDIEVDGAVDATGGAASSPGRDGGNVTLSGDAVTLGEIDVSGSDAFDDGGAHDGGDSGNIDITSSGITSLGGDLKAVGGVGVNGGSDGAGGGIMLDGDTVVAEGVRLLAGGNLFLGTGKTLTGTHSLIIESTDGSLEGLGAGSIGVTGSVLTLIQHDDMDLKDFMFALQNSTDLMVYVTGGAFTAVDSANGGSSANAADQWKSIQVVAVGDVDLRGPGDIVIGTHEGVDPAYPFGGVVVSSNGGVSIISDAGGVYDATSGTSLDNVTISGISDYSTGSGADLPGGVGRAAVVVRSNDSLIVGPACFLTANGAYDAEISDDRVSVNFENDGEPIDVAIYVGSSGQIEGVDGSVDVGAAVVTIDNSSGVGAFVADAFDTVTFTDAFENSLRLAGASSIEWLEVYSRRTPTRDYAIFYDTLPYAHTPGMLAGREYTLYGTYVLRGSETLLALGEILALTKPVPLQQPAISFDPEDRGEVSGTDAEALMQWLATELGAGTVQVYLENSYLHSTDLRPYKVAARLMKLAEVLKDGEGARVAALTKVINEFVEAGTLPSDEQMIAVFGQLQQHSGDSTAYGMAGEWLEALASYVSILNSEMGWATDKSVSFVMGKYGTAAAEEGNVSVMAFIQMHAEAI